MNYQEFLQRFQYQDSPVSRYEFEKQFGGVNNLGLGPQVELADRGVHGRVMSNPNEILYGTEGQEGRNFLVATDRYRNEFPLSGALENWKDESPRYQNQVDFLNADNSGVIPGGTPASYQGGGLTGEGTDPWATPEGFAANKLLDRHPSERYAPEFSSHPFFEPGEKNISGLLRSAPKDYSDAELKALGMKTGLSTDEALAKAYPFEYGAEAAGSQTALDSAGALASAEAGVEAIEAAEAAESGWGGPATFAANQALNLIPTRDREKTKTPFGEEGSKSGILKGTGKGALLGATIGSYVAPGPGTAIGAAVGGLAGFAGGSQGYFDSTSAPTITMSRLKRRGGGMPGGLLGGGSMYG